MSATIGSPNGGCLQIRITGVASTAAGGQGEVANPEGMTLLITRTTLIPLVTSTAAGNLSCGIAASGGTFTDIINALAMGGLTCPCAYNGHAMQNTGKTAITVPALWHSTDVLGFTASSSLVGLDAILLVEYLRCSYEV